MLSQVFSRVGLPSEKNLLIFNGNYVDRCRALLAQYS